MITKHFRQSSVSLIMALKNLNFHLKREYFKNEIIQQEDNVINKLINRFNDCL